MHVSVLSKLLFGLSFYCQSITYVYLMHNQVKIYYPFLSFCIKNWDIYTWFAFRKYFYDTIFDIFMMPFMIERHLLWCSSTLIRSGVWRNYSLLMSYSKRYAVISGLFYRNRLASYFYENNAISINVQVIHGSVDFAMVFQYKWFFS